MKKMHIMTLMVLWCLTGLFAQSQELPFSYDSAKQQTGTVWFYKVTSLDKDQSYEVTLYQEDEFTIIGIFDMSDIAPQIQIGTFKYNPEYFCFDYSANYNPYAYARIRNSNDTAELTYDLKNKKGTGKLTTINLFRNISSYSGDIHLLSVPSYELSGLQIDLWYAMRFIKKDIQLFIVGAHSAINSYNEHVVYVGKETVAGKVCDKWQATILDGNGKPRNDKQIFWFDTTTPQYGLVKFEMRMKGVQGILFPNALIELKETKQFSKAEWQQHVEKETERIRIKLDIPVKK